MLALPHTIAPAKREKLDTITRKGYRIEKLAFTTEPGIVVPGLLYEPESPANKALEVIVDSTGKSEWFPAYESAAINRRKRCLALDLRGFGETAPAPRSPANRRSYFGNDTFEAFLGLHLNRPLLGQRVYDLLAVLAQAAPDGDIELVGCETAALVAMHAALLEPRIVSLHLKAPLVSWADVVRSPISFNQLTSVVPGVLAVYDLPELAGALAPRKLVVEDAQAARGGFLWKKAAQDAYQATRAAYEKAQAGSMFQIIADR